MTADNGAPEPTAPDTIVLIHGLWVTPRSWEKWVEHYEGKGYRVLDPAYPGLEVEVEVEALNEDPSPIEALTIPGVVEHYEGIIGELEKPPILMGHSMGGLIVQILLDHGYGAAGVAIDSVAPEGVRRVPLAQTRAAFPCSGTPPTATGLSASPPSSSTTPSPTPSAGRTQTRSTSATTSLRRVASSGVRSWPTSSRATRKTTSTTIMMTARRCCSSLAGRTTSSRRRSRSPTPSTTVTPRPSQTTRSSLGAPTTPSDRMVGRRSPTTRFRGPPSTPRPDQPPKSADLARLSRPAEIVTVSPERASPRVSL